MGMTMTQKILAAHAGLEKVEAGQCHYCPKGHEHCFINKGKKDLVFFAVVPQQ